MVEPMRDIYSSRVPSFFAVLAGRWRPQRWAVTWGQTTWWTVAAAKVDPPWRRT
jgi:hypothetical protein